MLKKFFISLLFVMVPHLSGATEVALDDVVRTLETPFQQQTEESGKIQDFQAEFVQESHIASINRAQSGAGTVKFKFLFSAEDSSPVAKFRWDYRQPNIQEIISDGQMMWVYLPENRQVIESDISQINEQQGENPVTFLSGLGNLSRDFHIDWGTTHTDESGNFLLRLKPRGDSQLIQLMELVVNKDAVFEWQKQHKSGDKFPILATFVTDQQGNRTAIEFRKIQVNQELKDELFRFKKPADVEVVTPAQMTF
ncbi:MAG: outer membrane lipoprotein carrier protein LolA [Deltaproteobacteria bacterium]|jgi:outer membrane lipoprotein carrier protein|nr:outer membrane lipoprotein carrier protein LolA [Deltaproteobacteria bacterium]